MFALVMTVLLAAPGNCPPEVGQIKWDGFSFSFNAKGKRMQVSGPIWDRDRNGKPSRGDLFRIDDASHGNGEATWVVLGAGLARSMNRTFKRGGFTARCEARFEVKGVPKVGSTAALGRMLLKQGGGDAVDPVTALDQTMRGWADDLCGRKQHIDEKRLRSILEDEARKRLRGYKRSTIKRTARTVAKDYGLKCAHLTVPRITFD